MKKIVFITCVSLLLLGGMFSCNKDEGPFYTNVPIANDTLTNDSSGISYKKDIQPIFNASCASCHMELHAKLNLMPCCSYDQLLYTGFNASYIDVSAPQNSRLYKHLNGTLSIMPPSGKLPDEQLEKILSWMEQGAKNN